MKKEPIGKCEISKTLEQRQAPFLEGNTGIMDDVLEVRSVCRDIEDIWNIGHRSLAQAGVRNEPWLTQTLGEPNADRAVGFVWKRVLRPAGGMERPETEEDSEVYRKRERRAADAIRERGGKCSESWRRSSCARRTAKRSYPLPW